MDRAQGEPHRHDAIAFLSSGTPDAEAALRPAHRRPTATSTPTAPTWWWRSAATG